MKYGVAIVGVGSIGRDHLRAVLASSCFELRWLVDPNRKSLQEALEFSGLLGGRIDVSTSLESALDDDRVQAVCLATPDDLHFADAKRVIESGKALLIEKPIAADINEAYELARLTEANQARVLPGHTLRFDEKYIAAKEIYQSGDVGKLLYGYGRRENSTAVSERIGNRVSPMMFLGIHDIDALMWILGERIVEVSSLKAGVDVRTSYPAGEIAILKTESGAVTSLAAGFGLPPDGANQIDAHLRLVCSAGELFLEVRDFGMYLNTDRGFSVVRPAQYSSNYTRRNCLSPEWEHFAGVVAGTSAPRITAREAADAVAVVRAIYNASQLGKTVEVEYAD